MRELGSGVSPARGRLACALLRGRPSPEARGRAQMASADAPCERSHPSAPCHPTPGRGPRHRRRAGSSLVPARPDPDRPAPRAHTPVSWHVAGPKPSWQGRRLRPSFPWKHPRRKKAVLIIRGTHGVTPPWAARPRRRRTCADPCTAKRIESDAASPKRGVASHRGPGGTRVARHVVREERCP